MANKREKLEDLLSTLIEYVEEDYENLIQSALDNNDLLDAKEFEEYKKYLIDSCNCYIKQEQKKEVMFKCIICKEKFEDFYKDKDNPEICKYCVEFEVNNESLKKEKEE